MTDSEAYKSLGWIESYFEKQAVASESVAKDFRTVEAKAKEAPPSESFNFATDVPLPDAIKRVHSYISVGTQTKKEALVHLGHVESWGKQNMRKAANLAIEVEQLKSEISQTKSTDKKAKENEDWKRLVYIETDEENRAFVYVRVDSANEDFAVGEAFLNSAMQVEFEPQPKTALTIQYLDAISTLLKNRSHELPVKNV